MADMVTDGVVAPAASAKCIRLLLSALSGRLRHPMHRQRPEQGIFAYSNSEEGNFENSVASHLIAFTVVLQTTRPFAVTALHMPSHITLKKSISTSTDITNRLLTDLLGPTLGLKA